MIIPAQANIPAIENALAKLTASSDREPLRLPTNYRHQAGGAEAALTQLIITWAQRNPGATLQTFLETDDETSAFVRRSPGLIAALCAERASDRQGNAVGEILRTAALARLNQLQSQEARKAFRGASVEIPCVDHLGKDAPYLLYLPEKRDAPTLRPRENFKELATWLLRTTIQGSYREAIPADAGDAIGGMLYEIFKNTEDHALTDIAGDLLEISVRSLKTNHHAMTPGQLAQIAGGYQPLANYCEALSVPEGGVFTHLFELSVLDSGPGFAASWKRKPVEQLSMEEEEQAVIQCFGEGSAKRSDRFGQGLPHVLRLLKTQKGFLRLRTGRLSFYIDFSCEEQAAPSALRRFDHADGQPFAPVAGSLLTILLPMGRPA